VRLPKSIVEGVTVNWPVSSVPVPASGTERVGFEAVEITARLPEMLPAACGANETVKVTLCAAPRVSGRLIPLRLNPVPLGVIWEMVKGDPPELLRVSTSDALVPVFTLPKLRLGGLDVI
jgi:hypothetical protein